MQSMNLDFIISGEITEDSKIEVEKDAATKPVYVWELDKS